jgi:mRNA interferase MazF
LVARGEVWLATLDPTIGSEINKTRPCLIVSPPEMHDYLRTVIVLPMTSAGSEAPYRIPTTFRGRRGLLLLDQVRTLDKRRLIRRVGKIDHRTLVATLQTLQRIFIPWPAEKD